MYTVKLYNNIAKAGLDQFTDQYEIGDDKTKLAMIKPMKMPLSYVVPIYTISTIIQT